MSTAKEKARFLEFKTHPYGTKNPDGSPMLNRYSSILTGGYNFPGAQAMLYAAGVKNQDDMRTKPHVGLCISSPVYSSPILSNTFIQELHRFGGREILASNSNPFVNLTNHCCLGYFHHYPIVCTVCQHSFPSTGV